MDATLIEIIQSVENLKGEFGIRPYPKTVRSVLIGAEGSICKSFLGNQPFFGSYPMAKETCFSRLNRLTSEGFLHRDLGGAYSVTEKGRKLLSSGMETMEEFSQLSFIDPLVARLDSLMINHRFSQTFSMEYLDSMANWKQLPDTQLEYKFMPTRGGYQLPYQSDEEWNLVKLVMTPKMYFKAIRGQCLEIPYLKKESSLYENRYFPDFVMLTHDDRIAIVECKPLVAMSNHLVISKYEALEDFCRVNGFQCCMIDAKLNSFSELRDRKIPDRKRTLFYQIFAKTRHFSKEEYNQFKLDYKQMQEAQRDILAIVIQDRLWNNAKNGFDIYFQSLR